MIRFAVAESEKRIYSIVYKPKHTRNGKDIYTHRGIYPAPRDTVSKFYLWFVKRDWTLVKLDSTFQIEITQTQKSERKYFIFQFALRRKPLLCALYCSLCRWCCGSGAIVPLILFWQAETPSISSSSFFFFLWHIKRSLFDIYVHTDKLFHFLDVRLLAIVLRRNHSNTWVHIRKERGFDRVKPLQRKIMFPWHCPERKPN